MNLNTGDSVCASNVNLIHREINQREKKPHTQTPQTNEQIKTPNSWPVADLQCGFHTNFKWKKRRIL